MIHQTGRSLLSMLLLISGFVLVTSPANATDAAWARVQRGGYTILIQGGDASGAQSPATDTSTDCTARTLSDRGHQLAQKLGARFAARGVRIDKVLTSSTCNARETARLSFGSTPAEIFIPLDPAPSDGAARKTQLEQIRTAILSFKGSGNLVLLTDRTNIMALTGVTPRPTEAVVTAPTEDGETIHVAGRIIFD
ncbi:histidine phosphatase family protein [Phyllobacterium sp. SB3]|uniref:histidine phosphatase family protein n=1 Tax=Phyllobacterium sp. SB3 TaxID=3156073 RepID=UPI0032AFC09E